MLQIKLNIDFYKSIWYNYIKFKALGVIFMFLTTANNTNSNVTSAVTAGAFIFFIIFIVLALLILLFYIFPSFGLYRIAKRKNMKSPAFAWIPVVREYLYGQVAFDNNKTKSIALLTLSALSRIFSITQITNLVNNVQLALSQNNFSQSTISYMSSSSSLQSIISLAFTIFMFVASYNIYKQLSDKATVMTVFNVLTWGMLDSIFLFAIRNNEFRDDTQ